MQEAKKIPIIEAGLRLLQNHLVKKYFSAVRLRADLDVHQNKNLPTIYYANHSSRWDHHLGAYITDKLWHQDTFLMVHESMLAGFPILDKTGCYSVDESDPLDVARSLKYTKDLLTQKPNRALWLFPQGTIKPNDTRPLNFQNGLALLVRSMETVRLVPVAFRYEFLLNSKPEAFVSFGKPFIFNRELKLNTRALTKQFENNVEQELNYLQQDIVNQTTQDFSLIIRSKGIFVTRVYTKTTRIWWQLFHDNQRGLAKLWQERERDKTGSRT